MTASRTPQAGGVVLKEALVGATDIEDKQPSLAHASVQKRSNSRSLVLSNEFQFVCGVRSKGLLRWHDLALGKRHRDTGGLKAS